TVLLLLVCWGILWFRERARGESLLDGHVPLRPISRTMALAALLLFLAAVAAYHLPLIEVAGINHLSFIGVGFTAYGLAWLPTVSLVLGARAYSRQISQGRNV